MSSARTKGELAERRAALKAAGCGTLESMLSDEQLKAVLAAPHEHKSHPLARLVHSANAVGNEAGTNDLRNTNRAITWIQQRNEPAMVQGLAVRLRRACETNKHHNAAAFLSEIRAAGDLAAAEFEVTPVSTGATPTPDFTVRTLSGDHFRVEVMSKQMDGAEATILGAVMRGEALTSRPRQMGNIRIVEHDVQPAGAPKRHPTDPTKSESGQGEVIARKFSRLKDTARQASITVPTLLWLDLQDEDWWSVKAQDMEPAFLGPQAMFWSNGFWHAFYGRTGTPLFVGHVVHHGYNKAPTMKHDGMFTQRNEWAGVVISLHAATVFFEHPSPRLALPASAREGLHRLPRFDIMRSWMSWPSASPSLERRVASARQRLRALARVARVQMG